MLKTPDHPPANQAIRSPGGAPPQRSIWCGIPVYNNAGTIFDVARRCRQIVTNVLVIDDGSTDADLTNLLKSLDVTVVGHPTNLGKGRALLTAFRYAADHGAAYLITLDGDSQHFPEDLPRFFPHLRPDTILIGYRAEVTGQMPRSSRFGREFSDFWIGLEAGGNARDTQSGFRAYPLPAAAKLQLKSHRYNFEMEIIAKALWAGMQIGSVPIRVWYPPAKDRISGFDPFQDNLRISLLHARLLLRQMLPIPHRQLRFDRITKTRPLIDVLLRENSDAIGVAVSAGLSVLMGIVLWPLGILAVGYVTLRLHLNKIVALVCVAACMPAIVPRICDGLGRMVVRSDAHPHWRWIAGAHLVAVPVSILVGGLVYVTVRRYEKQSWAVPARTGAVRPGSVEKEDDL